jgi:MoaD family protein
MKIKVKGFFSIKEAMGGKGEINIETGTVTIREMLIELSEIFGRKFKEVIFDIETGDVRAENQILINGRHYRNLAKGLDTRLNDEDFIALFPSVAGG